MACAARLIHPYASWFVVFASMASRGFNYQADDARPYALGTFVLAISVLFLVRWLDYGRWRDALLFAVLASLLWWVHLIFWPFYLIFAVYGFFRILRKESRASSLQAFAVCALIGCRDASSSNTRRRFVARSLGARYCSPPPLQRVIADPQNQCHRPYLRGCVPSNPDVPLEGASGGVGFGQFPGTDSKLVADRSSLPLRFFLDQRR